MPYVGLHVLWGMTSVIALECFRRRCSDDELPDGHDIAIFILAFLCGPVGILLAAFAWFVLLTTFIGERIKAYGQHRRARASDHGSATDGAGSAAAGAGAAYAALAARPVSLPPTPPLHGAGYARSATVNAPLPPGALLTPQQAAQLQQLIQTGRAPALNTLLGQPSTAPRKIPYAGVKMGEIIAWRLWLARGARTVLTTNNGMEPQVVEDWFLKSLVAEIIWAPGDAMKHNSKEGSNLENNLQGINAWKDKTGAYNYMEGCQAPIVVGRVALWGEVIEHERGYRAEYAKPISLDDIIGAPDEVLQALRRKYKVAQE